jgi:OOP family OmpA-OmpF porin
MGLPRQRRGIGLLAFAAIAIALPTQPVRPQPATASNLVDQLAGAETPADIDVVALRQQAVDRIKSRAEATALKRPLIAPQLLKLPQFSFDVVFDPDSSLIRPQSYQVIGSIADALSDPKLLHYTFLVICHTQATGRRDANLTLSQRRADSIRDVLAGTFKISTKRLQALGLGEEQLRDSSRPASPTNVRAQVVTIGEVPAAVSSQPTVSNVPAAKKGAAPASKKRR